MDAEILKPEPTVILTMTVEEATWLKHYTIFGMIIDREETFLDKQHKENIRQALAILED